MTVDSGLYGIPVPADVTALLGTHPETVPVNCTALLGSHLGTVATLTTYYTSYMRAHGWTFEPAHSLTDPLVSLAKGLGYSTALAWCQATSPISTVLMDIGRVGNSDAGGVEMSIVDNPGETSCP